MKRIILLLFILFCCSMANSAELRIIYTNDINGIIFPCDCGGENLGGMARVGGVIDALRMEKQKAIVVDSGNSVDKPYKASLMKSIMTDIGYNTTGSFLLTKLNGIRVAVVSSKDKGHWRKARANADLLVLLDSSNLRNDEIRASAADIVIGGVRNSSIDKVKTTGKAHILQTSMNGRRVGCADITFSADKKLKSLKIKLVPVGRRAPSDRTVQSRLDAFEKKSHSVARIEPSQLNIGSVKKGERREFVVKIVGSSDFSIIGKSSSGGVKIISCIKKGGSYIVRLAVIGGKRGRFNGDAVFDIKSPACSFELKLAVFGNIL